MSELLAFLLYPEFTAHFIDYEELKQSLQILSSMFALLNVWGESEYF